MSFEDDVADFLQNLRPVQSRLRKCGSALKIEFHTKNYSGITSEVDKKDKCQDVSNEDSDMLSMLKDFFKISNENPLPDDNLERDNQEADDDVLRLVNPLQQMWIFSHLLPGCKKKNIQDLASLSTSYRWLVNLLADVCCTKVQDVIDHQINIEKNVFGGRKIRNLL